MTNREDIISMALEALEHIDNEDNDRDFLFPYQCTMLDNAITALRRALEQDHIEQPLGMVDRELLELAAKAAGAIWIDDGWPEDLPGLMLDFGYGTAGWNPLTDDGDAMRLMVKLKMRARLDVCVAVAGNSPKNDWMEPYTSDPYAATRRAIVRAAAEIGKEMK